MANKKDDITKDKDVKKILEAIDSQINDKKQAMLEEFTKKMDEQIEISVQKRLEVEAKKFVRGKNGKIFRRDILIILLIAVIAYLGWNLYEIGYFNKEMPATTTIYSVSQNGENNAVEVPKVKEKTKDDYIKEQGDLIEELQIPGIYEEIQNGLSKETLSNALKLKIAYKNLDDEDKTNDGSVISFTSDALLESYQEICGEDQTLEYSVFDYENLKFLYFNDTFITESASIIPSAKLNYQITNAYEKNGKLTFELNYEGHLETYKYIFEKEGDNYYFSKIEKI